MSCNVDIEISENAGNFSFNQEEVEIYIQEILKKEYNPDHDLYLSLKITDNTEIQEINKEYREKDTPTDVISFAYNDNENPGGIEVIGDIIISIDRVEEQAEEYGHSVSREFYYVLTHGILHLLGYDHMEESDKKEMRTKEEELLAAYGHERK